MGSGIPKRRTTRRVEEWNFSKLSIRDYVCFLTGSTIGDRINTPEALREAREYHGCNYLGKLTIEDRERIFPNRRWR